MKNKHTTSVSQVPDLTAVYKQAWKLYKQKLPILLAVNAVPVGFGLLQVYLMNPSFAGRESFQSTLIMFALEVTSIIVGIVSQAALLYVIVAKYTFVQAYQKGWNIALPLFWVYILLFLRVFIGLLLLIVPGVYMYVKYLFADFVLIVEGKRGMDALSASALYVEGKWWKLFGILLVTTVVYWVIYSSIMRIPEFSPQSSTFLSQLFALIASPIIPITFYVLYTQLKSAKK